MTTDVDCLIANPYHTLPMRAAFDEGWRQQQLGMPADINARQIVSNLTLIAFWRGWRACADVLDG
jgi:hypothetical protein